MMSPLRYITGLVFFTLFMGSVSFVGTVVAQPSPTINYQGKLTDATGLAVADGLYTMEFRLYTAPTGGTALWTETLTGANEVQVQNGLFSVMLGSTSPLTSVNFNQPLFLGVNIEGDGEMTPRKPFGTVPAAFEAQRVGGVASTSLLRNDQAGTASGLLTFTGGLISTASSTIQNLTTGTATTTNLVINGQRFSNLLGTGLTNNAGVLTVATSSLGLSAAFSNSAQLAALLSDETGTGNAVFSASPTLTGTLTAAAANFSSTLSLTGSAANIALGNNWLSGDGNDEGIFIDSDGRVGVGTSTPLASARLTVVQDTTNGTGIGAATFTNNSRYLGSGGPVFNRTLSSTQFADISNTRTVTGIFDGGLFGAFRGITSTGVNANDQGTLEELNGLRVTFGGFNNGFNPVTTRVNGLSIAPFFGGGTFTQATGLFIGLPTATGATVTNYFGIYQEDAAARNYFAGNISIGTTTSNSRLTIQGAAGSTSTLRVASSTGVTSLELLANGNLELPGQLISAGIEWTARSVTGDNDQWQSVTYGNGLFVAVANTVAAGDRVMTSPDGITWTTRTAAGDNDQWWDITYGNGLFVAVGVAGDRVMTSPDGINWTVRSAVGNDDSWTSVTYGNGLFVAVGTTNDRVMTSPDGINWTARSAAGNNDTWYSVTYGNGLFVAVGDTGDTRVMTSPDGITWTAQSALGNNDAWRDVTYGNGLFVAVGYNGDRVMTSPDGVTWTARSAAGDNDAWYGVTYGNGLFVAVGWGTFAGDPIMTSPDGVTWTARRTPGSIDWTEVVYQNGLFVAVSDFGSLRSMTSGRLEQTALATNNLRQGGFSLFGNAQIGTTTLGTVGTNAQLSVQTNGSADILNLFRTNGTQALTVLESGNVGIGTSTPNQRLTVSGNVRITGALFDSNNASGTAGQVLQSTGTGFSWVATSTLGIGASFSNSAQLATLLSDETGTGFSVFSDSPTLTGTLTAAAANFSSTLALTGSAANIALGNNWLSGDGGDEGIFIDASGNVGIGTSTPSTLISAFRNINAPIDFSIANPNTGTSSVTSVTVAQDSNRFAQLSYFGSGSTFGQAAFTANSATLRSSGSGGLNLVAQDAAAPIRFFAGGLTAAEQRMTILSSGNVGIGTITPNSRLTIQGAAGSTSTLRVASSTGATTLDLLANGNLELPGQLISAGIGWTARSAAGSDDDWESVAYGNGLFVAVGSSGDRVMTSSDGTTWTARSAAGNDDGWQSVAYGNGLFVAVGSSGDRVMTSPDGITWTARSAAGDNDGWESVAYGNGQFVAVGISPGDRVMTSPDGINWTPRSAAGNNDFWQSVAYGNDLFVVVGVNISGQDVVMTSPDGITWTVRSAAGDNDQWRGVIYGNGLFVVVGNFGDRVMTSPDGINWTARSAAGNDDSWQSVAYGNGLFVAVGSSGDRVVTSSDGVTWTVRSAAGDNDGWESVAYGNGLFVAVGAFSGDRVMTSGFLTETRLATNNLRQGGFSLFGNAQIGTTTLGTVGTNAQLSVQTNGSADILNLFRTNGTQALTVLESGNVGIGTSTPNQRLTVSGNVRITGALFDSNNASGTAGQVLQSTGTGFQWVATSSLGIAGGGGGDFLANGSVAMTDTLFLAQGALGAGGLSFAGDEDTGISRGGPNLMYFETGGFVNFTLGQTNGLLNNNAYGASIRNSAGSSTQPTLYFGILGQDTGLYSNVDDVLNITTGGLDRLTIAANGNVGIGTTTPNSRLTVVGTTTITGQVRAADGSPIAPGYSFSGDTEMGMLRAGNQLWITQGSTGSLINLSSDLIDFTASNGSTFTSGSNFYGLRLYGNGPITAGAEFATLEGGHGGVGDQIAKISFAFDPGATGFGDSPSRIGFYTSPDGSSTMVERMTLNSVGNLGIGTTTPSQQLTVAGNVRITGALFDSNNASGTLGQVLQSTATGFTWVATSTLGFGASFSNSAQLAALLSDETGTGNVVFSASPTLTGTLSAAAANFSSTFSLTGSVANIALGNNWLSGDGADEGVFVDSIGRVGIGTSSPTQVLDIRFENPIINIQDNDATLDQFVAGINFQRPNGAGGNFGFIGFDSISRGASQDLIIGADVFNANIVFEGFGSTELARISGNNGNFGLGTSTPSQRLTVAGNVRITGALFDSNNASGTAGQVLQSTGTGFQWVATSTLGFGNFLANGTVPMTGTLQLAQGALGTGGLSFTGDPDMGISRAAADVLAFTTANSERMRILSNGNVLIGTATDLSARFRSIGVSTDNTTQVAGDFQRSSRLTNSTTNSSTAISGLAELAVNSGVTNAGAVAAGFFTSVRASSQTNDSGTLAAMYGVFSRYGHLSSAGSNPVTTNAYGLAITPFIGSGTITNMYDIFLANPVTGGTATNRFGIYQENTANNFLAGNLGLGTTSPSSRLTIQSSLLTPSPGSGEVMGINQEIGFGTTMAGGITYGERLYFTNNSFATTTLVGSLIRMEDSTTFGNTVRGLEIQTNRGSNTQGENTAISGTGRTFGIRGITEGDAGGTVAPAGGFFETRGTTQGNAIRGFSSSITSATLMSLFHDTSAFAGTGLELNFGNGAGSFSSSSSRFVDFRNTNTSVFTVSAFGTTTIGNGTNFAGLQIGRGGICVDNDGSCVASTSGQIASVSSYTGNSDLAEMYFSSQSLQTGEIVTLAGELSVNRARRESETPIIGVVSTKPGVVMGADDQSTRRGETAYPIALAGRVPIILSTENGPIKKGDQLMLSSIPGVAMRATATGTVVGIALEDFDDSRKYSRTFINQFGDDMVDPIYQPITDPNDPRVHDGCYYGGGSEGGTPCVPLDGETMIEQINSANQVLAERSVAEQLAVLAGTPSESRVVNGQTVRVGQIIMFVDLSYRWLDETQTTNLAFLMSTSSVQTLSENVDETLFDRLVTLAQGFVDGVLQVVGIKADRVEVAEELCIDGVCVNADQLRNLLNGVNGQTASPAPAVFGPQPAPAPEPSPESGGGNDAGSEVTPASEPPPEPEPIVEPPPAPEPAPEPPPEQIVEEVPEPVTESEPEASTEPVI